MFYTYKHVLYIISHPFYMFHNIFAILTEKVFIFRINLLFHYYVLKNHLI